MSDAPKPDLRRSAKLLAGMKRTQLAIAIAFLFDCLILLGFHFIGFVGLEVPLIVFVLLASMVGMVYLAHATGWSLKRKDPTLFLPNSFSPYPLRSEQQSPPRRSPFNLSKRSLPSALSASWRLTPAVWLYLGSRQRSVRSP